MEGGRWRMRGRRGLVAVVLLCAAGAVLVLVAAGRAWEVVVTARPAPLPELREHHSGADRLPWLPALGWAALAGAGALVATRAGLRRAVGGLLVLAGAGIAAGAAVALAGGGPPGWPGAAAAGGLGIAVAGALAVGHGRRWPAMGSRYERPDRSGPPRDGEDRAAQLWAALDRGEDPTAQ